MKVLILNNMVPFVYGGAEQFAENLVINLRDRGVDVDLLRIPFKWEPYDRLVDEMFICKSMRVPKADRVLALKFPTYLLPCENKTFWLVHQYRQAYDLWDAGMSNIPDTAHGRAVRETIIRNDNQSFAEAEKIFSIQHPVAERLKRYNNFDSEVLIAPLSDTQLFSWKPDEGYIAATGRINHSKRQWMLVEAMKYLPDSIRLVIAGPADTAADAEDLRRRVRENDLEDRVTLDIRFLDRQELADIVNRARAVACLPFDEDSMGYVAMEAYEASKPVVTLSDSGGVLQIVIDGETGCVSEPNPESLARAVTSVMKSASRAEDLGRRGHERWRSFNINWTSAIDRLLG